MLLEKKYTGIKMEEIVDKFLAGSISGADITADEVITIISRCTSQRHIEKIKTKLFTQYPHKFNRSHENVFLQWAKNIRISFDTFEKLINANVFSKENIEQIEKDLIKNMNFYEAETVRKIFGNKYDKEIIELLLNNMDYYKLKTLMDFFGEKEAFENVAKEIEKYINSGDKANTYKFFNFLLGRTESYYGQNRPSIKFNVNQYTDIIKYLYAVFANNMTLERDTNYFKILRMFREFIEIDDGHKTELNRNKVKDLSMGILREIGIHNIPLADTMKYLFEFLTNNNVKLPNEIANELNSYEVLKKLTQKQ